MKLTRMNPVLSAIFTFATIIGCSDGDAEQLSVLQAEISQLTMSYEEQLAETRAEVSRADSLQTTVHDMEQEIMELQGNAPVYNASDAEEEAIEALVHNLHDGWAAMFKTKNTDELLKYFLTEYTASAVRINVENVPQVRRKNDSNFEEWLNDLLAANDISLSFGETKFLYSEVRGVHFVTTYRTTLRLYENNQQIHTNSLVVQLAGERDNEWKVGHYNWVLFNY